MQIKLWGVRGSLPTPLTDYDYRDKLTSILSKAINENLSSKKEIPKFINNLSSELKGHFGGNTTCAEIISDSGKSYIIDCGTGIRPLGDRIISNESGRGSAEIDIFMTHTHWDHVQGLPFFKPIYFPGNKINFYSPIKDLEKRFIYQQDFRFFPVKFEDMAADKTFTTLTKGQVLEPEPGLKIDFRLLKHPGASYAYRFRQKDKTLIFCTDAEFTGEFVEIIPADGDDFFHETDVLIIDSQYTLDESFIKLNWGHTSYTMAVNLAVRWKVKKLILTHHEPSYSDIEITENCKKAEEHRNLMNSNLQILPAIEGQVYKA